jgi:hypothetical protein
LKFKLNVVVVVVVVVAETDLLLKFGGSGEGCFVLLTLRRWIGSSDGTWDLFLEIFLFSLVSSVSQFLCVSADSSIFLFSLSLSLSLFLCMYELNASTPGCCTMMLYLFRRVGVSKKQISGWVGHAIRNAVLVTRIGFLGAKEQRIEDESDGRTNKRMSERTNDRTQTKY